jgi:hypothetical protein
VAPAPAEEEEAGLDGGGGGGGEDESLVVGVDGAILVRGLSAAGLDGGDEFEDWEADVVVSLDLLFFESSLILLDL